MPEDVCVEETTQNKIERTGQEGDSASASATNSRDTKKGKGSASKGSSGVIVTPMDLDVADANGDLSTLLLAGVCDLMQSAREAAACSSDFVLMSATDKVAKSALKVNQDYNEAVMEHKKSQEEEIKKNAKHQWVKHPYGSPQLHQYRNWLAILEEEYEKGRAANAPDSAAKKKAITQERDRIQALDDTVKAENGIRLCKVRECYKGSEQIKIQFKLDQMQEVGEDNFFMQDMFIEVLKAIGGDQKFGPAPPTAKERKLRAALNEKRRQIARRRQ